VELKEVITNTFKELILPELGRIKEENKEIKNYLSFINKRLDDVNRRLDDVNIHLVPQALDLKINDIRLDQASLSATPIPEPATLLLLGSGLIGLAGLGRKRLKR